LVTEGEDLGGEGGPRGSEGNQEAKRSLTTVNMQGRYWTERASEGLKPSS